MLVSADQMKYHKSSDIEEEPGGRRICLIEEDCLNINLAMRVLPQPHTDAQRRVSQG